MPLTYDVRCQDTSNANDRAQFFASGAFRHPKVARLKVAVFCSILQYCSQVNMLEQSAVFQCCSFFSQFAPALRLHEDGAESCDFRFNPRWCLAGRPLEGEPLGHPGGTGEMVMLKQYTLVTHYKIC